jgi:hypothetical protein
LYSLLGHRTRDTRPPYQLERPSSGRPPASENRGRLGRTVRLASLGSWASGVLRDVAGNTASGAVRAYWLARDRERFSSRDPVPGVTASTRLPLLCGRRGAVLLRSRRSPGAVPRRHGPLSNAGPRRRESLVTGPVDSPPVAFAAPDRSTGASLLRFRSHPFDVHWPCRAVRGLPASGPSRFGVALRPVGTQAGGRVALAVFVPRVSGSV